MAVEFVFWKNTHTFDFIHNGKTSFFHGHETISFPEKNTQVASAKYKKKKNCMENGVNYTHTMNETVIYYILLPKHWHYHRLNTYFVW